MKRRHTRLGTVLLGAIALGIATISAACSSTNDNAFASDPDDKGFQTDAGVQGQLNPDAACASETRAAEQVPLSILLVMDRSGSMSEPKKGDPANKWNQARNAMIAFADAPAVTETKLGLTVFPPDTADQCVLASYTPVVPIGSLPGAAVKIKEGLLTREPLGGTPMLTALAGGVEAMNTYLTANPNEQGVIILVTDGDPGGCVGDGITGVASIAERAAKAKPSIRTFVVGMDGATFANLDIVAKAGGGAPKAFTASATNTGAGTPQQQLLESLQKIRTGAIGCEYRLPLPDPTQGRLDLDSVAVNFTPGGAEPMVTFRRVETEADCSAATGGFYYDDNDNPAHIILCTASCDDVRNASTKGKVDVLLGCIQTVN